MPCNAPLPVAATIEAATGLVRITFDRGLQSGLTAPGNWLIKADITTGNRTHTVTAPGTVATSFLTLPTFPGGLAFPPLGVTYSATPADLVGLNHMPVAPFLDLPITVI